MGKLINYSQRGLRVKYEFIRSETFMYIVLYWGDVSKVTFKFYWLKLKIIFEKIRFISLLSKTDIYSVCSWIDWMSSLGMTKGTLIYFNNTFVKLRLISGFLKFITLFNVLE